MKLGNIVGNGWEGVLAIQGQRPLAELFPIAECKETPEKPQIFNWCI